MHPQPGRRWRWWSSYVVVLVVLVVSGLYPQPPLTRLFLVSALCLADTSFVCSTNINNTNNRQSQQINAVVQARLPTCMFVVVAPDYGGAALSVDWGEDPTMFQYDTVIASFDTGQVITDLPPWNTTTINDDNNTTTDNRTSYYWNWNLSGAKNTSGLDLPRRTITILHTYTQPGQYWPIHRSALLSSNVSRTEWYTSITSSRTCQYQPMDAMTNIGYRNESHCLPFKEWTRPRIDIGTDGSCSIVEASYPSSSPPVSSSSHLLSSGAVFCTSILLGVVGFVATSGF